MIRSVQNDNVIITMGRSDLIPGDQVEADLNALWHTETNKRRAIERFRELDTDQQKIAGPAKGASGRQYVSSEADDLGYRANFVLNYNGKNYRFRLESSEWPNPERPEMASLTVSEVAIEDGRMTGGEAAQLSDETLRALEHGTPVVCQYLGLNS